MIRCTHCGHPRFMHNGQNATVIFGTICPGFKEERK